MAVYNREQRQEGQANSRGMWELWVSGPGVKGWMLSGCVLEARSG